MLSEDDRQWIREELEQVQATMMNEFSDYSSLLELRQRSHAAALRALDAEVEAIADRVKKLES